MLVAQTAPLLTPDKLWSTLERSNVAAGFPNQMIYNLSYWMKTGQDTIVNGKTYVQILYATDENHSVWRDTIAKDRRRYPYMSVTNGLLLREKNGKVYRYDKGETREDNEESLLYDFNLREGETISRYLSPGASFDYIITSRIDSIRYENIEDVSRKVFYVSNYSNSGGAAAGIPEIWIEGIGSLWGLERKNLCSFYTGCQYRVNLICFYQNEELRYHLTRFDNCYYNEPNHPLGIQKVESALEFQLYPNPTSGKFVIQVSDGGDYSSVNIYNITGNLIGTTYQMGSSGILEVDLSGMMRGIYLVKLEKNGKLPVTKKLIIK